MKKIVILGNSIAAIKAVEIVKSQQPDLQAVLLPLCDHPVVDRQRYVHLIENQLKAKQIYYKNKDFYEANNITIINEKKVTRVNVTRKKIHFDDRSQIDFESLIVCDTPDHRFGEMKGANKTGVFGFQKLKEIDQISTLAALNDTMTIEGDQWWALELALKLSGKKKEVILSISSGHPLIQGTSEEYQHWLQTTFHEKGVSLLINNPVVEILGESDLKAVRIRSGKVYATELVILEKTHLDTRVFSESLELSVDALVVDEWYRSNVDGVYAADHAALRSRELWNFYGPRQEFLDYQARLIAAALMGKQEQIDPPVPVMSIDCPAFSLCSIGQVAERRGVASQVKFDTAQGRFVRIFEKEGRVIGMITLNLDVPTEQIIEGIRGKQEAEPLRQRYFAALDETPDPVPNPSLQETVLSAGADSPDILEQTKSANI